MPRKRKPRKFLNLKQIERFLRDYKKMPYKDKSSILAAVLIVLAIPVGIMFFGSNPTSAPLDLAPLDITGECYITGCADHLCLDTIIDAPVTNCEIQPQYQCLPQSKCERQPSGQCGWTQTPEYLKCLSQLVNP